jgi:hypothetical protein
MSRTRVLAPTPHGRPASIAVRRYRAGSAVKISARCLSRIRPLWSALSSVAIACRAGWQSTEWISASTTPTRARVACQVVSAGASGAAPSATPRLQGALAVCGERIRSFHARCGCAPPAARGRRLREAGAERGRSAGRPPAPPEDSQELQPRRSDRDEPARSLRPQRGGEPSPADARCSQLGSRCGLVMPSTAENGAAPAHSRLKRAECAGLSGLQRWGGAVACHDSACGTSRIPRASESPTRRTPPGSAGGVVTHPTLAGERCRPESSSPRSAHRSDSVTGWHP